MQTTRQSELFASKDWTVLYRAFTQVNFNASDPSTINTALRDYIATNYPEDFNDWIESSEFVALIDLLAWLAGTLAFKTDINARENFLETAEARESVLRLARFLSYNPRRNRPATGLVKLVEVSTDDDIQDSTGANLAGMRIQWNNADDPDWFERFTTVLSNAFVGTNRFGTPLRMVNRDGIRSQLYRMNCVMGENSFGFNTTVGGMVTDFEICNGDISELGAFVEQSPDNSSAFNLYYRNDGSGHGSERTGFFMLFKQGTMHKQTFDIEYPQANMVLDIDSVNVNETDVWFQSLTDGNITALEWEKVPAIFSDNITYNTIDANTRNIFSVITRDNDRISLRFADGNFGAAPLGPVRCWYRVSNGRQYQIRPTEINRITQKIVFYNASGTRRTINLVFSLQETVSNSTPRESVDDIKERAPAIYSTQNRMVSGEDYNTFPMAANVATKIKAVNRIYSGHSRFVDLNDPTSTYTDVVVTADDGMMYWETANIYEEITVAANRSAEEMTNNNLQNFLRNVNVRSYVMNEIITRVNNRTASPRIVFSRNTTWNQVTTAKYSSSGWFSRDNDFIRVGTQMRFRLPNGEFKWATIGALSGMLVTRQPEYGIRGPVTLSEEIPSGSKLVQIIPAFIPELPTETRRQIVQLFKDGYSFSLWFDPTTSEWVIDDETFDMLTPYSPRNGPIHIANVQYFAGALWKLAARGTAFVLESARKVRWYHDGERGVDGETGMRRADSITILGSNADLNGSNVDTLTDSEIDDMDADSLRGFLRAMQAQALADTGGIGENRVFGIASLYHYGDGTAEPRRVQVDFMDSDADGFADDPTSFALIANLSEHQGTLFWRLTDMFDHTGYQPIFNVNVFEQSYDGRAMTIPTQIRLPLTPEGKENIIPIREGELVHMRVDNSYWRRSGPNYVKLNSREFKTAYGRGPNTAKRWIKLSANQMDDDRDGIPDDAKGDMRRRFHLVYSTNDKELAIQKLSLDYLIRDGSLAFKWKHYSPVDTRIDPAMTNIVDIFILTRDYDYASRLWISNGSKMDELPKPPTELDLRMIMRDYEDFKMFSDEIVWRPVSYKFLFGVGSEASNLRAKFKVVRLPNAQLSDGEIRSTVINAINQFFDVTRWDFGETFYFTELAAFVHQTLAGSIGSIVIVPMDEEASFGDNFEVRCRSDEVFISTAQVEDVEIISSNTPANLRIR